MRPITLFVLILAAASTIACTAQRKASHYSAVVTIDDLPNDICIINDEPQIISLNIENSGDMGLTYINSAGDLVTALYGEGLLIGGTERTGTYIFTGNLCEKR